MDKRLSVIIEGESLLNDGTAVVLFQILLTATVAGELSAGKGIA
jgi:CPA1 family monovalent cation:H+ antiporter